MFLLSIKHIYPFIEKGIYVLSMIYEYNPFFTISQLVLTKYELSAHVLLSFVYIELVKVIFNTSCALNSNYLDIKLK